MIETTTIFYVETPTIPAGTTISEYRRSRPRRRSTWQRLPLLSLLTAR